MRKGILPLYFTISTILIKKVEPAIDMYNSKEHLVQKTHFSGCLQKKEPKVHHSLIIIQYSIWSVTWIVVITSVVRLQKSATKQTTQSKRLFIFLKEAGPIFSQTLCIRKYFFTPFNSGKFFYEFDFIWTLNMFYLFFLNVVVKSNISKTNLTTIQKIPAFWTNTWLI